MRTEFCNITQALSPRRFPSDAVMNGTLHSDDCRFALELNGTTTHLEVYYSKAIHYTCMITLLAFVQASSLLSLLLVLLKRDLSEPELGKFETAGSTHGLLLQGYTLHLHDQAAQPYPGSSPEISRNLKVSGELL